MSLVCKGTSDGFAHLVLLHVSAEQMTYTLYFTKHTRLMLYLPGSRWFQFMLAQYENQLAEKLASDR